MGDAEVSRLRTVAAGAFAVAALLAGCGVDGTAVKASGDSGTPTSTGTSTPGSTTPGSSPDTTTAPDGAFRIAKSDNVRVVVTVVEDMACPACKAFEAAYGSVLDEISDLPGAAVDYRIISFLDRMSDDKYSSRAANASYCVWNRSGDAAQKQDVWLKFQTAAFRDQPREGGPGLPDSKLADLAASAGAPDAASCITTGKYKADVASNSAKTLADPSFEGTPTILVNGEKVDLRSAARLLDMVEELLPK
ncbi:DsbA family protein [Gordonia phthalatica]|uniref:Thioredoxin-like fold domain-containing protein n=1 Tax=Gordonia phthalatica TaxID=1136941 RepID=A0A0N9MRP8_9ACTN|nr:thioredoxin domain-containing protein [Gordonia phthalatica]ALG85683.1 hypothetical protein ACH46_15855 [Gordonia phthalatica]